MKTISDNPKAFFAWFLYGMRPKDFYRLRLDEKPLWECRNWVDYPECCTLFGSVNSKKARKILNEKIRSYQHLSEFYKRDMALVTPADIAAGTVMEKVQAFANLGHQKMVIKPLNANKGQGVGVYDNVNEICSLLITNGGGVIEALIVQQKQMSDLNESSVNTLRINTVNYGNSEVEVVWPCLRMGRAGSFVDNAGAGGIFGAIDAETGVVIGVADENRNTYTEHPDSHKQLVGFIVPQWQEACDLAKQVAMRIPDAAFIGWDLALTDDGWVVVEGNQCPLIIWQIASGEGIRKKFHEIERRLIYRKKKP